MTFDFFLFYPYVSKAKSHEIWGPYRVSEKFGERVTGGVGKFTYPPLNRVKGGKDCKLFCNLEGGEEQAFL